MKSSNLGLFSTFITNFSHLDSKQKLILIVSFSLLCVIFVAICCYDVGYFISLFAGFLCYIILIVASFFSINKKMQKKITEARRKAFSDDEIESNFTKADSNTTQECIESSNTKSNLATDSIESRPEKIDSIESTSQKTDSNLSKDFIESNSQKVDSKQDLKSTKANNKKILKFLDLSKITLGFEMSFSLPRSFAFAIMIALFFILIYTHTFYALPYIAGIFLASIYVILYLFINRIS